MVTRAVYPCVYREHNEQDAENALKSGLSLCIQGTQFSRKFATHGVRFIPVYTGNTFLSSSATCTTSVYPCVYREHIYSRISRESPIGLSLCIQGTQNSLLYYLLRFRFIPVYTGNTKIVFCLLRHYTVYPCVYREHLIAAIVM